MCTASLLFLDEPTSGLDSSAAFSLMGCLRTVAERLDVTICAVVHQPSWQACKRVHSLCLLSDGRASGGRERGKHAGRA